MCSGLKTGGGGVDGANGVGDVASIANADMCSGLKIGGGGVVGVDGVGGVDGVDGRS